MKYVISDYYYNEGNTIVLIPDNWDDYSFKTLFNVNYIDDLKHSHSLGSIKIGMYKAEEGFVAYKELPSSFENLPDEFFSLWQSADSYQKVKKLQNKIGINIFKELNDIAFNLELFERYIKQRIVQNSLLRSVSSFTVKNQFHRITLGQAKLTPFSFSYSINRGGEKSTILKFDVEPDSFPPSNIHVLIGGNGVGKSTLIRDMIIGICDKDKKRTSGEFVYNEIDSVFSGESEHFANIICVSFSPFDDFSSVEKYNNEKSKFTYIGTKKEYEACRHDEDYGTLNILKDIENQFIDSLKGCLSNLTKREDLSDIIKILENDPMFYNYQLNELIISYNSIVDYNDLSAFKNIFEQMSSGHKVVLSIIVRCIDKMEEKTILFLDEPDNHLHPPLVSSLVRAISFVLMKRNGVAIISTHSTIVLQETPKSCVWLLSRVENNWNASRPRFETFGENIGTLTNDVFKYEINNTGFHALLKKSVKELKSYEEVVEKFNNQLGDEARGLIRILFAQKERGEL